MPQESYYNNLFMRVSLNMELTAMMVGSVLFLMSVLGYLGALRENLVALKVYSVGMYFLASLLFLATALIAVSPFVAKNFFHRYDDLINSRV